MGMGREGDRWERNVDGCAGGTAGYRDMGVQAARMGGFSGGMVCSWSGGAVGLISTLDQHKGTGIERALVCSVSQGWVPSPACRWT